ncbi:MAG: hypothetical protein HQL46_09230 [Gammaproteobacteria bacterium]|nr:hypothetical protein [Gammaproteobacteria bacterium]
MGLFDIFKKEEKEIVRELNHPKDLNLGDMIEFELMEQSLLANRSFQVKDIWTLNYGSDKNFKTYFDLDDVDEKFRLCVIGEQLELARSVLPDTLLQVFQEDDIASILDPDTGVNHTLQANISMNLLPEDLVGWISPKYRQEGFEIAYRYQGDYRIKGIPAHADEGEIECDYAWLVSDDRKHSIEFRVFDGGRTEVHLCVMLPMRKMTAMWPSKS